MRWAKHVVFLGSLMSALASCGGGASDGVVVEEVPSVFFEAGEGPEQSWELAGDGSFAVEFALQVGEAEARCGERYAGVGTTGASVEFHDARFFVSNVQLIGLDGLGVPVSLEVVPGFSTERVALLDFEDGSAGCEAGDERTNNLLRLRAEPGTYAGLAFTVGVPEELNHLDPTAADPPLDLVALHWGWTDGYRFLRVDTATESGASVSIHLGSVNCDQGTGGVVCEISNRPQVALLGFNPDQERVVLDYGLLMAEVDLNAEIAGCISGALTDSCPQVYGALGIGPEGGSGDFTAQTAFRAATRQ